MGNFTKAHAQWWDDNAKETERNDSKRKKAVMQGQSANPKEIRNFNQAGDYSASRRKPVVDQGDNTDRLVVYGDRPKPKQKATAKKKRIPVVDQE